MRTFLSAAVLAVSSLFLSTATASPSLVVIDFEGVVGDAQSQVPITPYVESGYTFTSTTGVNTTGIFGKNASNSNGSATLAFCAFDGPCGAGTSITMAGTSPFSLLSIDVGNWFADYPAGTMDLIGYLAGGGTVMTTLATGGAWTTNALVGFNDLLSVDFKGYGVYAVAFDKLIVETGGTVPEPAGLALVGLALCGWAGSARRRRV